MLLTRNPKDSDKSEKLKEIFMTPEQEEESRWKVKLEPGFHFQNTLQSRENEYHQDCVCSLSYMLGQTEKTIANYEHKLTFWHMVNNPALQEQPDIKQKKIRVKRQERNMRGEDIVEDVVDKEWHSVEEVLKDD